VGRAEEALTSARRSATIADLPEAHLVLGQALEKLAKYDQSMSEYNLARRAPVEGEAALGRARILVRMGATRDALSELAVLQKDARFRTAALLLAGDSQSDLGEKDKARSAYEAAVKSAPPGSEALGEAAFKLGRALADAGKRKPSVDALERALKAGAGDKASYGAEAYLLIGDGHRELRHNDAAVKAYKRYLELAPADARAARAEVERHIANLGGK
jgi:tetratricopeptide (TPR) repeat protein